jgi:hypothetical protein
MGPASGNIKVLYEQSDPVLVWHDPRVIAWSGSTGRPTLQTWQWGTHGGHAKGQMIGSSSPTRRPVQGKMLALLGGSPTGDGGGENAPVFEARGRDAGLTWSHGPQGLLEMPRYCTVLRPSAPPSPIFSPLFLAATCVLGVGKVGAAVFHPTKFPAPNPDRGSTPRSVHLRGSSSSFLPALTPT